MRLIHTADLHLDSKLDSNFDKNTDRDIIEQRREEILGRFIALAEYAHENNVDVVLIAGDLFDTKNVKKRVVNTIISTIEKYPHIDFLYLRGNHDLDSNFVDEADKPSNLKLFKNDEWTEYRYGNVSIFGRQSALGDPNYGSLMTDRNRFNIVTLHGQTANLRKAKDDSDIVALKSLQGRGIDYLALGHIHSYCKYELDTRGAYCYSGCLEGRGFDECGRKGFCLLDINDTECQHTFVPFNIRQFHEVQVDITALKTQVEILDAIKEAIEAIPSKDMVKIELVGTHTLETERNIPFFVTALADKFFLFKVKDHSKPFINVEDYRGNKSLKGEFIEMVSNSKLSEEDKQKVMMLGIKTLLGVGGEDLDV